MRRRLLRALLAVATVLVVWLVVSPASAAYLAAPVCDPRGAIGFAPPPQLQDEQRSLDIPVTCFEDSFVATHNVVPGSRGAVYDFSAREPVAHVAGLLVLPASVTRLSVDEADAVRLPPGVEASLDRPPQA